jgi:hypothetical protein
MKVYRPDAVVVELVTFSLAKRELTRGGKKKVRNDRHHQNVAT